MSIELSSFSFGFKTLLFSQVDLIIPKNEITVITGENGSGKTTLCRLISGFQKEYHGSIKLDNIEIKDLSVKEIADFLIYHKQEPQGNIVAATPEEDLSIWQSKFIRNLNEQHKIQREEVLAELDVIELLNVPFWEQSSGQVKRSGLAALLLNPDKFWILDEPFTGLHQELVDKLFSILQDRMKSGFGALIISHKTDEVKQIADRVLRIENEQIKEI
ncbi:ABC transporter ATP-binding protein [Candidatus Cloacimonadota bacterium]